MSRRTLLALATTAALGCGGPGAESKAPVENGLSPPIRAVVREGDPAPAVAAFLSTEGIEPGSGAAPAVVLAAVIEARLAHVDARVMPQYDGVRVDVLGPADALMKAMFDPVTNGELEPVKRKLDALARLSSLDSEPAACVGELARGQSLDPSIAESVRARTIGIGRVGLAVVGRSKAVDDARAAFHARRWPALAIPPRTPAPAFAEIETPSPARAIVFARAPAAAATAAAERLAHPHVPLESTHSITVVLHARDACVALDLDADPNAIALGKRALAEALANDASVESQATRSIADAGDVRDAAARAAVWALASDNTGPKSISVHATGSGLAGLESALARAEADLSKPVLETSTQTEPGTGSVWVLVASPCGTESEGSSDAGSSALFATSVAKSTDDVTVEPWIASDAVGLVAHAVRPVTDERVGEVLGRALFRAEPTGARSQLVKLATDPLAVLGIALSPGHPSWIVPTGTPDALLRMSDASVATRAAALRAGPWRAVAITDRATSFVDVDRWIPRSGARACPTGSPRTLPSPGTYAASSTSSEAYLAFPLDPAQLPAAPILVAALEDLLVKTLAGTIRSASARLLGAPRAPAIVAHLDAPSSALDAAVLQARVLFERLRKSGFAADELARAKKTHATADVHARLDPRERLIRRWRNAPQTSVDDAVLQSAASAIFRDEALVVIAARPGGKP